MAYSGSENWYLHTTRFDFEHRSEVKAVNFEKGTTREQHGNIFPPNVAKAMLFDGVTKQPFDRKKEEWQRHSVQTGVLGCLEPIH